MFDIVLSIRDNIEWIPIYLNSYKRCTKYNQLDSDIVTLYEYLTNI